MKMAGRKVCVAFSAAVFSLLACRSILGIDVKPIDETDGATSDVATPDPDGGPQSSECQHPTYAGADFCDDFEDEAKSRARWTKPTPYENEQQASLRFENGSVVVAASGIGSLFGGAGVAMYVPLDTIATTVDGGAASPALQLDVELTIDALDIPQDARLSNDIVGRTGSSVPTSFAVVTALTRAPDPNQINSPAALLAPGAVVGLTSDAFVFGASSDVVLTGRTAPVRKVLPFDPALLGRRLSLRVVTGPRWVLSRYLNTCQVESIVCRDCAFGGCPSERNACKGECQSILDCINATATCDEACRNACVAAHDAGAADYAAIIDCVDGRYCSCGGYCGPECPDGGPPDPGFIDDKTFVLAGPPVSKLDCVFADQPLVPTGAQYAAFVGAAVRGAQTRLVSRVHVIAVRQLRP